MESIVIPDLDSVPVPKPCILDEYQYSVHPNPADAKKLFQVIQETLDQLPQGIEGRSRVYQNIDIKFVHFIKKCLGIDCPLRMSMTTVQKDKIGFVSPHTLPGASNNATTLFILSDDGSFSVKAIEYEAGISDKVLQFPDSAEEITFMYNHYVDFPHLFYQRFTNIKMKLSDEQRELILTRAPWFSMEPYGSSGILKLLFK